MRSPSKPPGAPSKYPEGDYGKRVVFAHDDEQGRGVEGIAYPSSDRQENREDKWQRFLEEHRSPPSEGGNRDNVAEPDEPPSRDDGWKFRLIPALSVLSMVLIISGFLLTESVEAGLDDVDSISELDELSEMSKVASWLIKAGIVVLALVVAGIAIEYNPRW